MDKKYMCYCGLYCENCATKARVEPAALVLYEEMKKAGFEDVIQFLPDGIPFWNILRSIAEEGACVSCKGGSGNPACEIRLCAKEKGVSVCACCDLYPCDKFGDFLNSYPMLKEDNALLRDKGIAAWSSLQDERKANGYTYAENITL